MYKSFVTHQLALSFDRAIAALELTASARADSCTQEELKRCSRNMLLYFNRSLRSQDRKDAAKNLFVSLTYLRDCKEMLDRSRVDSLEIVGRFEVLQGRLEQLFWETGEAEQGQLRMLG